MKVADLLQEDTALMASVIANLLKKGEKVAAYAEVWNSDPRERKAELYPVASVTDNRIKLRIGQQVATWFEMNGDETDDSMYFQKEGDTWVLAEKKRKPILA